MSTFNKIIDVLKKEGRVISKDTKMRVRQLVECLKDENSVHKLDDVILWL